MEFVYCLRTSTIQKMNKLPLLIFGFLLFISACATKDDTKSGFALVYEQDFESPGSTEDFVFTDADKWRLSAGRSEGKSLEFTGMGEYHPRVRSPFIIGLMNEISFGDFVMEADLLQTGKEYGHRDMCIFLGFQDSIHFYYVHLATRADSNAHNIFIVNDQPRISFAEKTTDGRIPDGSQ